jgi:hypothetical protein
LVFGEENRRDQAQVGVVRVEGVARGRVQLGRAQQLAQFGAGPCEVLTPLVEGLGDSPQPDQRAKTACSAGPARRPSACSVRTVRSAARLARTRVTAPDGARSSWLSGANRGAARSTSGSATGMGGPSPAAASTPSSVTVALSTAAPLSAAAAGPSLSRPSLAG